MANITQKKEPSRTDVWHMFDRIAHRYDVLNRLLSFGQDVVWRNRVACFLPNRPGLHIIDLATGTGDLLISIFNRNAHAEKGVGMDMAEKMLDIGRRKMAQRSLDSKIVMKTGNAVDIPSPDAQYDAATISFGIRNVADVHGALSEMRRVLRPGGRALILEFSLPANALFRRLYLFYFRNVLPRLGALISGDRYAYRYLNQTVETFPYGEDFCRLMRNAGFEAVHRTPLTFGIATIYQGDRPGNE